MRSADKRLGLIMVLAGTLASLGCQRGGELSRMLPDQVAGWRAAEAPRFYDGKKIFDYMDGGAELYLAYDFRGLAVRRYGREGLPTIQVEVYDLGRPPEAYGVFSFERQGTEAGVGQDSEYAGGLLRFWRGRYFVSVLAEGEAPSLKPALLALGLEIAGLVKDNGRPPALLGLAPPEGLAAGSQRFFHLPYGLTAHYFVANENVLNLGPDTDVLLSRYGGGARGPALLLVDYPDKVKAAAGEERFRRDYLGGAPAGRQNTPSRDKGLVALRRCDRLLAVLFAAPSEAAADEMLDEVERRWREQRGR